MSRSFRTQKESTQAERRVPRDRSGNPILPRIIERRPRDGDIHPLTKQMLIRQLRKMPVEFYHGLQRIELRARETSDIGQPFGLYLHQDRTIILYSLPMEWESLGFDLRLGKVIARFQAQIEVLESGIKVRWPNKGLMAAWFLCDVLAHELGHHFDEQYRHKNGLLRGTRYRELSARLHAERFELSLLRHMIRKKSSQATTP